MSQRRQIASRAPRKSGFPVALGIGGVAVAGVLVLRSREGRKAVSEVAKKVAKATGTVSVKALNNIKRYDIASLVQKHRRRVPWALAMAVIDIESMGTFNPNIYNYCASWRSRKCQYENGKRAWKVGYYGQGALPTKTWAHGLFQILEKWRKKNGNAYAGVSVPRRVDLFDPETNIKAGCANLNRQWRKLEGTAIVGIDKWAATYFGHNQGGGSLRKGIRGASDTTSIKSIVDAASKGARELRVALKVGARVAVWAALKPSILG